MSDIKSRYWVFVLYPDSAGDYVSILEESHVKVAVSPLHDRDINPDGELKKPHKHVLVEFDGPTTQNNVNNVFGCIAANGVILKVNSARGMYRYLCHLDNPDKAQYNESDICHYNGFNAADLLSETDKNNIKWQVGALIFEKGIDEYADLVKYLWSEGLQQEYYVVINSTIHFKGLCDSIRHKKERVIDKIINKD